jgi:Rrf2 family nitric oxide-sensitive transcriptional repressor
MQLSLQTDFALRTLMALATARGLVSVDDLARRYDISRNHLAKVAQRLQAEGFIETFRGRGGGMRLARPAADIQVGEVVRRMENLDSFVACFGGDGACTVAGLCSLKPALAGALEAFLVHLDSITLAELLPDIPAFIRQLERTRYWRPSCDRARRSAAGCSARRNRPAPG